MLIYLEPKVLLHKAEEHNNLHLQHISLLHQGFLKRLHCLWIQEDTDVFPDGISRS